MRAKVEKITPDMAKEYLTHNEMNRSVNNKVVSKYSRDMKAGNWELNGEPICFNTSGNLVNGQHRLYAIVKAGVPVDILVVRDVSDTATIYDKNHLRSTRNTFEMEGADTWMKNRCVVSTARLITNYETKIKDQTDSEIRDFLLENESYMRLVYSFVTMGSGCRSRLTARRSVLAGAYYAMKNGVKYEDIYNMFQIVNSGFCTDRSETAAIILRNHLLEHKGRSVVDTDTMFITQMAIRDYVSRVPRTKKYSKLAPVYK